MGVVRKSHYGNLNAENILTGQRKLTCHVTGDPEGGYRATAIWIYQVGPGALSLVLVRLAGLFIQRYGRNRVCEYCVCVCV